MRRTGWLAATLLVAGLTVDAYGATIQAQESSLGGGTFRFTYSISTSPFVVQANDVIDITFDPTVYLLLSNPIAQPSSDWTATMDQPNVPFAGLNGDYFLQAKVNNPSLVGPFSVDFTLQPGKQAGSQAFSIFDPNFMTIDGQTGQTILAQTGVPEPATFSLAVAGILLGVAAWKVRRRASRIA